MFVIDLVDRAVRRFEDVLDRLAQLALFIMMVLICADAGGRYLLDKPVPAAYEMTEMYLMIGVVFLALARNQALGGNVAVDFLVQLAGPGWRRLLGFFYVASALLVYFAIAYMATRMAVQNFSLGRWTHGAFPLPTGPSWALFAVGAIAMTLRLALQMLRALRGQEIYDPSLGGHH